LPARSPQKRNADQPSQKDRRARRIFAQAGHRKNPAMEAGLSSMAPMTKACLLPSSLEKRHRKGTDIGGKPPTKRRAARLVLASARAPRRGARPNPRPWGIDAILARTAGRLSSSIASWTALAPGGLSSVSAAGAAYSAVSGSTASTTCSTAGTACTAASSTSTTAPALGQRTGTKGECRHK
jgi:hypothetical protein